MADPDSSLTPEQRLLKLIEEQESSGGAEGGSTATKGAKPRIQINFREIFSPAAIQGRLLSAKDSLLDFIKAQKGRLDLKRINNLLKVVMVGCGIYLMVNVLLDLRFFNKDYRAELALSENRMADFGTAEELESNRALFEVENVRNIFAPFGKEEEKAVEEDAMALKVLGITENLRLTGISVHPDDPKRTFCMIEDLEKDVTTFLKEGDTISGLKVAHIKPDSVVLQFQDEEVEIR